MIADLRELDRRTGGEGGARREAFTEVWREARAWFAELAAELGLEPRRDAAGNVRFTLAGEVEPRPRARLAPRLGPRRAAGSTARSA